MYNLVSKNNARILEQKGNVNAATDIKSAEDLLGKALKGSVTKESAVKPKYTGNVLLMLEPAYQYLILEDVST